MSDHFFHNGMAEALGVSQADLEAMTIREMAERAFDLGYLIDIGESGLGPGLTLSGPDRRAPARAGEE